MIWYIVSKDPRDPLLCESPLFWALEPGSQILILKWSSGLLLKSLAIVGVYQMLGFSLPPKCPKCQHTWTLKGMVTDSLSSMATAQSLAPLIWLGSQYTRILSKDIYLYIYIYAPPTSDFILCTIYHRQIHDAILGKSLSLAEVCSMLPRTLRTCSIIIGAQATTSNQRLAKAPCESFSRETGVLA